MEAESTESTEAYLKITAWLYANRKMLLVGVGVAAVIAIIFGIMAWQKSAAEASADSQLMSVPLVSLNDGRITPTSAAPFLDTAKQYPDTSAGEYAELLGARAYFIDGKYADAHQEFSKFIDAHPDSSLLPQARVGVAASLEGEGKISDAAQKYQEVLSSYANDPSIVSPVKLTLARLDETLNKPQQALTYYEDLAKVNNPYDPWAAEARERGSMLLMRHPELRKAPPAASSTTTPTLPTGASSAPAFHPPAAPSTATKP